MKLCERCGALLPQAQEDICPACGALQRPDAPGQGTGGEVYSSRPLPEQDDSLQAKEQTRESGQSHAAPPAGKGERQIWRPAQEPRAQRPSAARGKEAGRTQRKSAPRRETTDARRAHDTAAPRPGAARRSVAAEEQRNARAARLPRVLGGIVLALVVLLAVASAATYFLYENFNAEKSFRALGDALQQQDIAALQALVETVDAKQPTEAQLRALCGLFTTPESVKALRQQLAAQVTGKAGAQETLPYPPLRPGAETVFLGYSSYKLVAAPVSLRVPATIAGKNPVLYLDDAAVTGEVGADGVLYHNLFPGVYRCKMTAQSLLGETVTGEEVPVSLLRTDAPTDFDGALPIAHITVGNCLSDTAQLTVDGKAVEQKPVEGVVSLPDMRVGSTIEMSFTTDYGAGTRASVVFADKANTQLLFENHVTEGGVPEESSFNSMLGAWFASYLDARNNTDAAKMTTCTELVRGQLTGDIGSEESKQHAFAFKSAAVDMQTVLQATYEALPALIVNAKFEYTASHRETFKAEEKVALYTVEFVYQEGWKVNRIAAATQAEYDAHTFATLPK